MMFDPESVVRCERCGERLNQKTLVWLEYDTRYSFYTDEEVPLEHSQGGFTFGKACAEHEKELYRAKRGLTEDL